MKINAQIFFPILLINLNLIFSLKYIIIPFQVQKYDYKDDRNGLLHEYLYKDIMINLSVGTPKQSIPLLAGMGEYSTYIVSNEASDLKGKFDKELSQTYYTSEEINEIYSYQTFSEAFPSKETIYLENPETQINNYEFFLVTKIGKNICYLPYCEILTQPGVIGFKMAESETYYEKVNNTNLILQLKNKEIIDNYDFSFFFESPEKGSIIIGQKPHEYDNAHYKQENFKFTKSFIDNEKEKDWGLYFNKIYFGDSELASDKTMLLRVEGHSYFHYYCRKDTDISSFKQFDFIINDLNINITLTKDDLFIDDGDKLLFLIVFGHPQPILGFPVFKKYQFIFNQDTNTIGLYNKIIGNPTIPKPSTRSKSDDGQKPNSYKLIVFLLFFVIVVLSIYIVRTYLHNRKMKEMRMILNERNKEIQLVSYEKFDS